MISLKAELRKLGLRVGGNKPVLLDWLRAHSAERDRGEPGAPGQAQPAGAAAVAPTPKQELVKKFFEDHIDVITVDCSKYRFGPPDPDAMKQLGEYSLLYNALYSTKSQNS